MRTELFRTRDQLTHCTALLCHAVSPSPCSRSKNSFFFSTTALLRISPPSHISPPPSPSPLTFFERMTSLRLAS